MTNTQLRILSAIVMAALVIGVAYMGTMHVLVFMCFVGVLCVDEFYTNFVKKNRIRFTYFLSQFIFLVPFIYLNLVQQDYTANYILVNLGFLLNVLLLLYLFATKVDSTGVKKTFTKHSYLCAFLVLFPFSSLASILYYGKWIQLLTVLLLINFGMDTGAWFFGKNFGRNKLWPSVSPNKTIEGLVGGALFSAFVGVIGWNLLISPNGLKFFMFFVTLGLISQMGDLIQSKLKRQFEIKDSSHLIPGHGGVYDRIDSLVFVAPFYAMFINFLNL